MNSKSGPKPQTIASKKYQEKVGLVSKSYKLRKEVVDDFKNACDENGISQAAQLTRLMIDYVNKGNGDKNNVR